LVGIWVIVCVQKPFHHFLQIFRPLRMFKIVFRDSLLYPKQSSLFCLLTLISPSANRIDYITNFCSMVDLLHELKNSSFQHRSFRGFHNVSAGQKENLKFVGLLFITKNWQFSCILYAHQGRIKGGGQRGQLPRVPRCKGAPMMKFICFKYNTRLKNFRDSEAIHEYNSMYLRCVKYQGPPTATDFFTSFTVFQF